VQEMLHTFIDIAPVPLHRESEERVVEPDEKGFSGFVFKIHANIDPRHRDRVAFLRVVSGEFKRNTFYKHVRLDKSVRFNNPYSFMAASKDVIEEAYPGDVIGLYDTGNFKIGDTLTDGENIHYKGIPSFSPELFMELVNADPMKSKQLDKGIRQLTDEGVAQLFVHSSGHKKVVGTVGQLQFDVIQYRLENEYGAKCRFSPIQMHKACWMTSENKKDLEEFIRLKQEFIYYDKDEQPVFMAETSWALNVAMENNTGISFHTTTEFMNKAG
jgi:peptide chain release factor 3